MYSTEMRRYQSHTAHTYASCFVLLVPAPCSSLIFQVDSVRLRDKSSSAASERVVLRSGCSQNWIVPSPLISTKGKQKSPILSGGSGEGVLPCVFPSQDNSGAVYVSWVCIRRAGTFALYKPTAPPGHAVP